MNIYILLIIMLERKSYFAGCGPYSHLNNFAEEYKEL